MRDLPLFSLSIDPLLAAFLQGGIFGISGHDCPNRLISRVVTYSWDPARTMCRIVSCCG
ncbi:MAG TPA: hypothetical protein HA256_07080 [Methanoregulaceae archaeon]|nr:hypothetical protein [Methanoregulaceae archaeon]